MSCLAQRNHATCLCVEEPVGLFGRVFFFDDARSQPANVLLWSHLNASPLASWIESTSLNFSKKCVSCLGNSSFLGCLTCLTCIDVLMYWCIDVFSCLLACICSLFVVPMAPWPCRVGPLNSGKSPVFEKNMQSLRVRFLVHQAWWWLSCKSLPKCSNVAPRLIWCYYIKVGSWDCSHSRSKNDTDRKTEWKRIEQGDL